MNMTLSEIRQAEGYEIIAKILPTLGQISPEEWHLKTKIWSIKYRIPIEEILPLYKPTINKHPPPPAKPISVKVAEANPIKVAAVLETLICGSCQTPFEPKTTRQKFCSNTCSSRERNRKHRKK